MIFVYCRDRNIESKQQMQASGDGEEYSPCGRDMITPEGELNGGLAARMDKVLDVGERNDKILRELGLSGDEVAGDAAGGCGAGA